MSQTARLVAFVVLSFMLFAVVFPIAWFIAFFLLWEFVFGDTYGGRWQVFAWPIALIVAVGAVVALWHFGAGPLRGGLITFVFVTTAIAAICLVVAGAWYVF